MDATTRNVKASSEFQEAPVGVFFEEITKAAEELGDGHYGLLLTVKNGTGIWKLWDVSAVVAE